MRIVRYTTERKKEWDEFVASSRNGTFILQRDYMDYHKDRYVDHSLLFYDKGKLITLLPANISDGVFYSHQGLTYGGFIYSFAATAQQILESCTALIHYIKDSRIATRVVYRAIPYIYHTYPAEEDLYALFRNNFILTERKIASVIYQEQASVFSKLRRRKVKRAVQHNLQLRQEQAFAPFWCLLEEVLMNRHRTRPVHTLQEMERLHRSFPGNIRLYGVYCENVMVGGSVVYESAEVVHLQYIAANDEGREKGALDLLFDYLINNRYLNKRYIDFGVSVEQGGWVLNKGLQFQKEGFGGRAVMYDTYRVELE